MRYCMSIHLKEPCLLRARTFLGDKLSTTTAGIEGSYLYEDALPFHGKWLQSLGTYLCGLHLSIGTVEG